MAYFYYFFLVLAALSCVLARPSLIDLTSRQNNPSQEQQRADAVKDAFLFSWNGYYMNAFPNDELHPINNSYSNSRNGWGATAVDAFSTALVMQIPEVVDQILEYVPEIDFDHTKDSVSLFETTIRYLGGLLSAYDLLNGPLSDLNSNQKSVDTLLKQATHLADNLAFAFDTPSGVPVNDIFLSNRSSDGSKTNILANAGTLVLEWTHLSDLTGDEKYARLSQKGMSYLMNPQPKTSEPYPGLVGFTIDLETGNFKDSLGGWVGGADSYYEYLIKMYVYDTNRFESYRDRWVLAADSSIAHLASHPSSRPDLTFLAVYNGTRLIYESQHLACFDGGNFILGGLVLDEQKYIDFGLELVNGCHETYSKTITGIGPEIFRWVTDDTPLNDTKNPQPPANQVNFYKEAGFFIQDGGYGLRPEVIESFYYAYRATHDQKYRDWAWNAFVAINATCRAGSGFVNIANVNAANGGKSEDFQDSFWFAEALKYSYLIHAPENEWLVDNNGVNKWVYNTEGHPFRVAGTPV